MCTFLCRSTIGNNLNHNNMKKISNNDFAVNKKIVENSNEPDQYLSELQIYPGFAQNSESESPKE